MVSLALNIVKDELLYVLEIAMGVLNLQQFCNVTENIESPFRPT